MQVTGVSDMTALVRSMTMDRPIAQGQRSAPATPPPPPPRPPIMTPQQALASNAELGPPTGGPNHDNRSDNIHSEIKVNGKVVARFYNTGLSELADEYSFIAEELNFDADTIIGPDLAASRAARAVALLEKYGVADKNAGADALANARATMEFMMADTAMTQQAWLAEQARGGKLDPGSMFSREA